jgi:hypothetical protein
MDNSDFSVDGVLTDFPVTASGAVGKNYSMLELEGPKTVVYHGFTKKKKKLLSTMMETCTLCATP